MTTQVDVVLAVENGTRIVSSVDKCPLCDRAFGDLDAVLRIRDLDELATTHLHRRCVEDLFLLAPGDGVSDKDFERFRQRILAGAR